MALRFISSLTSSGKSSRAPFQKSYFQTGNSQWGGVAIGEHLGQLLTALFLAQMARLQSAEGSGTSAALAGTAAFTIAVGTGEGVSIALGGTGEAFSAFTIAGYLALTFWLLGTGSALRRHPTSERSVA